MSLRTCFVVALVGIAWSCVLGLQRPPPRYSQQFMPHTTFTCRNKIVGSYYADPETDCQLFHVCVSEAGSVQDYKFLCPNDTAFDQESQTCADWYDVDCEAATLYYASDNFDLYRLGSGMESLHYDSVRSDAEPQDNLQRSETSDPVRSAVNNLNRAAPTNGNANSNNNNNANANSRDILRGSSSINFYNSRNGGKDEDYDSEKPYEPVQEPRKKSGVRKVARKQQHNTNDNHNNVNLGNNYAASSTVAPIVASSPSAPNGYHGNYNGNYNRQRTTGFPSSTTASPVPQDNYNGRNPTNQKYNAPTSTYRPSTGQQTYSTYQAPSTTVRTTAFGNYNGNNYNTNNNQQQTSNSYGVNLGTSPKPTSYSQNYPSAAVTTSRPTSYSQNYPDQQNFNGQHAQFAQNARTQSTTAQPGANFEYTKTSEFANFPRSYNNIQRSTSGAANNFPSTTTASTFFDSYNTNNAQYNKASGQPSTRQTAQTTKFYPPNFAGSSYVPTTYSPATKKSANGETNAPVASNGRGVDRYNSQATGNDNGQYVNQQNPAQPAAKSSQFYESTRAPKKINGESQARGADRHNSQATGNDNGQYVNQQNPQVASKASQYYDSTRAPKKATQYSGNYDITNNGKYHESSTGSYDTGRSQAGIGFSPSSINHLAETPRSTTPTPKRTGGPTTYSPNSYNAANRQQTPTTPRGTTLVSGSARPFSTTARFAEATTPRPKTAKKNDYDYAYYDNAGGLEYDGLDLEHVVAGNKESSKIARS